MKKCLRCPSKMIENFNAKVEGTAYGLKITQQGIFKDNLAKIKCAVFPACGHLEVYIEDTSKLKQIRIYT